MQGLSSVDTGFRKYRNLTFSGLSRKKNGLILIAAKEAAPLGSVEASLQRVGDCVITDVDKYLLLFLLPTCSAGWEPSSSWVT